MKHSKVVFCLTVLLGCNSPTDESAAKAELKLAVKKLNLTKPSLDDELPVLSEIDNPTGCVYIYRGGAIGEIEWRKYTESESCLESAVSMLRTLEENIENGKISRIVYVIEKQGGPRKEDMKAISEIARRFGISEVLLVHSG